jgi:site-specific DNA recombinase
MPRRPERTAWVSYLRVSTHEQADRELSLPAQRHAIVEYAAHHGATLAREFVDAGHSGTDPHRPAFQQMLEAVLRPGSDIAAIVVQHTSRFSRDATEARVVKAKLRRLGVRVLSACQDIPDEPLGSLIEGIYECIDQYESQMIGLRTKAAMAEAVRQGYFPGAMCPYGYCTRPVEVRPGVVRHQLVPHPDEAEVVREIYRLTIALGGAKSVARALNQRGFRSRTGALWSKDQVLNVLAQTAVIGTHVWGKSNRSSQSPPLSLSVEPIVDPEVYALAHQLHDQRQPSRHPGHAAASPHPLSGLVRCGKCGGSYTRETSGKQVKAGCYQYGYYNCRRSTRIGKEACPGYRIRTEELDAAVAERLALELCRPERVRALRAWLERHPGLASVKTRSDEELTGMWKALLGQEEVVRNYLRHLTGGLEVHDHRITFLPLAPPVSGPQGLANGELTSGEEVLTSRKEELTRGAERAPSGHAGPRGGELFRGEVRLVRGETKAKTSMNRGICDSPPTVGVLLPG